MFSGFFTNVEEKLDGIPDITKTKIEKSLEELAERVDSIPEATKIKLDDSFKGLKVKVEALPDIAKSKLDESFEALEKKVDEVPEGIKSKLDDSFEAVSRKRTPPEQSMSEISQSEISRAEGGQSENSQQRPRQSPLSGQRQEIEAAPLPFQLPALPIIPANSVVPPQLAPAPPPLPPAPPQLPPDPPQLPLVPADRPSKRPRLEEPTSSLMDIGYAFSKGKSRKKRPETLHVGLPERIIQLILNRDKDFPKNRVNFMKRSKEVNICWASHVTDLEVIEWNMEGVTELEESRLGHGCRDVMQKEG